MLVDNDAGMGHGEPECLVPGVVVGFVPSRGWINGGADGLVHPGLIDRADVLGGGPGAGVRAADDGRSHGGSRQVLGLLGRGRLRLPSAVGNCSLCGFGRYDGAAGAAAAASVAAGSSVCGARWLPQEPRGGRRAGSCRRGSGDRSCPAVGGAGSGLAGFGAAGLRVGMADSRATT